MRDFDEIFDRGKRREGDFNKRDSKRGDFGNRERPRMYEAICDNCGKKFELPFKPTGERNVYCNDCFKGDGNNPTTKDSTNQCNKEQMEALGKKLDKIIELLTPKAIEKDGSVEIKEKKAKEKKEVKKKAATKKK